MAQCHYEALPKPLMFVLVQEAQNIVVDELGISLAENDHMNISIED